MKYIVLKKIRDPENRGIENQKSQDSPNLENSGIFGIGIS